MVRQPREITDAVHILEGLEHLDQGITIFDQDLKLVAWNTKFLDLYGYPADMAYRGASFDSFIRYNAERGEYGEGDVSEQVGARVETARKFQKHQLERTTSSGATILVAGTPLPNGGFVTTYSDTTRYTLRTKELQRQVDQRSSELQLSEERLSLIADEVPAGIAHVDKDMTLLYMNKRFARAYQVDQHAAVGLNAYDVLHPNTMEESSRFFEQARRGILVDFEMRLELPGGRFKDVRTLLRPEKPSSGEVIGFYLVSIDVTRRKSTLNALMRSQKMDALGRMASGISHDFNNLLTIILGNLNPLTELISDELVEEYVAPSISAARRGSSLTKRLVSLARREQFDPAPTDIGEAITEIAKLLESSVPESLTITVEQSDNLPIALVDLSQLEMAMLNLTLNARDATDGRGNIEIRSEPFEMTQDHADMTHLPTGLYVKISFHDNGCGMAPDLSEKIFEPFFTSKAAGSGSGLGLSMVYGFVQQSNGAVFVDSTLGKGTTFSILLPSVELNTKKPLADPSGKKLRSIESPGAISPTSSGLVLLVDDDIDVRRTVRRKIAGLGYPVVEAGDADEALNLIRQIKDISIVISDIGMPGTMDGIGLAHILKSQFDEIKVILMSGNRSIQTEDELPSDVIFLKKPFEADELRSCLTATKVDDYDGAEDRMKIE